MDYSEVILVDENDAIVGYMDKMEAHRLGKLHRAISVFILNSNNEWLVQRRASGKYHSADLWSNATCTHPMRGESNQAAAHRRLMEEIGLKSTLKKLFDFTYRAELDNQLVEHELDHIFVGYTDDLPHPNPKEVSEYRYISVHELSQELESNPDLFTPWFRLLFEPVLKRLS